MEVYFTHHVVRAFKQALAELEEEGGVAARHKRYCENHRILVEGMRALGFKTLLPDEFQSPSSPLSFIRKQVSISTLSTPN